MNSPSARTGTGCLLLIAAPNQLASICNHRQAPVTPARLFNQAKISG
jgi:hypothetical protein